MEAVRYNPGTKKIEFVELPIPEISDQSHVLVKVAYAGICGSDLHLIKGEFPSRVRDTFTLGHEFCGTVIKVGSEVKLFLEGDRVVINPTYGCRNCDFCELGRYHYCKVNGTNTLIGLAHNGGWANYALVSEYQIHKIPDNVTMEQAVLSEPISCLVRAWELISPVAIGESILIIGAGTIGHLFSVLLSTYGHKKVVVSEPNEKRGKLLQNNTGHECLKPEELRLRQQKDANFLFDIVVDFSANTAAIEQGFYLLKYGGKLCLFGVPSLTSQISISPIAIVVKEIKIFGSFHNPYTFPKALPLVEAMGERYLNYDKLGVKLFPLKNYMEALKEQTEGTIVKGIFKF